MNVTIDKNIRRVDRGDSLPARCNEFVVDEETGGLLIAVPVGRDDIHG